MTNSRGKVLRALGVVAALLVAAGAISPAFGAKAITKNKAKQVAKKQATNQINALVPGLINTAIPGQGNPLFIQEAELVRFSFIVNQGGTQTLATHGPLTFKADCVIDGANLEGNVYIETTEAGTAFGGDDTSEGSIGPATPLVTRTFENPGATSAGAPAHSDGYDDQFSAIAPSGPAVNGTASTLAHKDVGTCKFYGHLLKVA
jgi:hypothetical protein